MSESNTSCFQKSGLTIVRNNLGELVLTHTLTGWRVCIDDRKLNVLTQNDHFSFPFIDQILNKLPAKASIVSG